MVVIYAATINYACQHVFYTILVMFVELGDVRGRLPREQFSPAVDLSVTFVAVRQGLYLYHPQE